MSTVYVVQEHLYKDRVTGKIMPKFDLSPAEKFGDIKFVLSSRHLPHNEGTVMDLHDVLQDFTEDDYLLPIGSTILMCAAAVVAAEYSEKIQFLYWNGKKREYQVTPIDFGMTTNFFGD